jgi:membrane protein implicated in regulation of membrane protease activity
MLMAGFNSLDRIFLISTLLGGALFVARLALNLIGHHGEFGDGGVDVGHADIGGMSHDIGAHGTESSFRLLSVQGLTAFFLMFGLMGLALHRGSRVGEVTAIFGAFLVGVATMALMAKLAQMMQHLQSSGNVDIGQAVGCSGVVYLHIPAGGGTGQVQIDVMNHLMVLDAMAEDKQEIKTGERVEVVEVIAGNVLVVKKV